MSLKEKHYHIQSVCFLYLHRNFLRKVPRLIKSDPIAPPDG